MPNKQKTTEAGGGRRSRLRLRGMMSTKTGKAAGAASIVAPIVGFIVNDIKKPNSIIKALANKTVSYLLMRRPKQVEAIDITDKVEIIEEKQEPKAIEESGPDNNEV
jgi:hypothetical protein